MSGTKLRRATMALDQRIQALPQELQDIIFDLTMELSPGLVKIDEHYCFPWQLHIDHSLRTKFAEHYFRKTIFVIPPITPASVAPSWLRRLESTHCRMVARICLQLECDDTSTGPASHLRDQQAQRAARYIVRCAPNLELESMMILPREESIENTCRRFNDAWNGPQGRGA